MSEANDSLIAIEKIIAEHLNSIRPDKRPIDSSEYDLNLFGKKLDYQIIDIAYLLLQLSVKYAFVIDGDILKDDKIYSVNGLAKYIMAKAKLS